MDNIAFIPRDDVYSKKKVDSKQDNVELKSSLENLQQNQPSEHVPVLIKISNNLVSQTKVESKTQESIETVFEKRSVEEDKTESITDSTFHSVAEKSSDKQTIETVPLNFELREPLPITPSRKKLIDSLDTLKSPSNSCSIDGFHTSRLPHRRTNVSSVFPIGCMGCKDDAVIESSTTNKEKVECYYQKTILAVPEKDDTKILQESRRQIIRRKDGNPLLGVGYEDSPPTFTTTACKIPPGGFSHGLW